MKFLILIILMIAGTLNPAFASMNTPPTGAEKQYLYAPTLNSNPGFELGFSGWASSEASTVTSITTAANVRSGSKSISWNPSVSGTVSLNPLVTIPANTSGILTVECYFMTTDQDYDLELYSSTSATVLKSQDIVTDGTGSVYAQQKFKYPLYSNGSSNTVTIQLKANGNEAVTYIDDCSMRFDTSDMPVSVNQIYSATISNADAVTNENADWINGNCTDATTGEATCTFTTGYFNTTPNCLAVTGSGSMANVQSVSSTSVMVQTRNSAGTLADASVYLYCQRAEPNNGFAVRMDQTNYDWMPVTCTGTWSTNTTYSCMERRNGSVLTVRAKVSVTGAPTSAGLSLTVPLSRTIDTAKLPTLVANVSQLGSKVGTVFDANGQVHPAVAMYGSTTTVNIQYLADGVGTPLASVTQAAPMTFANGDTVEIEYSVPIVGWTEGQNAPLIIGGVTNSHASATMKIEAADINCDAASTINSQFGSWVSSVGNISGGQCTITLASGIFSSTPYCFAVPQTRVICRTGVASTTSLNVNCQTDAAVNVTAVDVYLTCIGPR